MATPKPVPAPATPPSASPPPPPGAAPMPRPASAPRIAPNTPPTVPPPIAPAIMKAMVSGPSSNSAMLLIRRHSITGKSLRCSRFVHMSCNEPRGSERSDRGLNRVAVVVRASVPMPVISSPILGHGQTMDLSMSSTIFLTLTCAHFSAHAALRPCQISPNVEVSRVTIAVVAGTRCTAAAGAGGPWAGACCCAACSAAAGMPAVSRPSTDAAYGSITPSGSASASRTGPMVFT